MPGTITIFIYLIKQSDNQTKILNFSFSCSNVATLRFSHYTNYGH